MNKEIFIETINSLEKQYNHDRECSDALSIVFNDGDLRQILTYNNSIVVEQTIKLLKILMHDNHKDSWIDYYIYELDYGHKYKPGSVTNADDSNIDLSDAGALYEFLLTNKK